MRHTLDLTGLSARNRRVFRLGIHGGATDTPLPLSDLLEQSAGIADLNDDDLAALTANLRGQAAAELDAAVESGDSAAIDAALAAVEQATAAITAIEAEQVTRETAATELAARVEAARASLTVVEDGPEDPDADPEADPSDPEAEPADPEAEPATNPEAVEAAPEAAEPVAEPIAAAATSPVAVVRPRHTAPRPRTPASDPRMQLVASANAPGIPAGTVLVDGERIYEDRIANLFDNAIRASRSWKGSADPVALMTLGSGPEAVYGRDRVLGWDERTNEERINRICSPAALVASGGACAPTPVLYDEPFIGSDVRPVRDGLARFGAERGGVRLLPAITVAQVSAGVAAWTAANDIALNSPAVKPCVAMTCPSTTETLVDAITHCMTIGNFRARFFPEQVAAWARAMAVQTARFAESRMLTEIGTGSTNVNAGQIFGTTRDVLGVIIRAAAALRNRYRIDADTPMRLIAPEWLKDNMITDLTRETPGASVDRLMTNDAYIDGLFRAQQINVSWTLDGESGQIFGAQAAGDLLGWISTVVVYLFPEGSWLFLDGGTLDLGIVRDSVLNATNDFQMFGETFENVAFHGVESQRITIDICPSGITQAPAQVDPCTTGS